MNQPRQEFKFGDYALIKQKRYGVSDENYVHKVIGTLLSNTYVDVPVKCPATETIHDEIEPVVACICCGVSERDVRRYRESDVYHLPSSENIP